jgi:hypothetical protein
MVTKKFLITKFNCICFLFNKKLPFFFSEEEEDEMSDGEEGEENVQSEATEDNYDEKHVKFAEEQETYSKIKEARQEEMFPDEVIEFLILLKQLNLRKFFNLASSCKKTCQIQPNH